MHILQLLLTYLTFFSPGESVVVLFFVFMRLIVLSPCFFSIVCVLARLYVCVSWAKPGGRCHSQSRKNFFKDGSGEIERLTFNSRNHKIFVFTCSVIRIEDA
jgi:hypothetical protein